ncbi:hypothetical protein BJ170DRAFT_680741 [Xylariales sp. AK1849]|nr:hypothetical protein BJ170DRAFT_680741 [Xylariales sp. AK1849]
MATFGKPAPSYIPRSYIPRLKPVSAGFDPDPSHIPLSKPASADFDPDGAWTTLRMALGSKARLDMPLLNMLCVLRISSRDLNNPACDKCIIYNRSGKWRLKDVTQSSTNGNSYNGDVAGCDTGGLLSCTFCKETEGGNCTTMGLDADSWAVEQYIRARGFHWYEGFGRKACDSCVNAGDPRKCDIWSLNGCSSCRSLGLRCNIDGYRSGSLQERLMRRWRLGTTEVSPFVDHGRDLAYLWALAVRQLPMPDRPNTKLIPSTQALLEHNGSPYGNIPPFLHFAHIDQARAALVEIWTIRNRVLRLLPDAVNDGSRPRKGCKGCVYHEVPCAPSGSNDNACERCVSFERECQHLADDMRLGATHYCSMCRIVGNRDCDASLIDNIGCTECRRKDIDCVVQGALQLISLPNRPDGLCPPMSCDACARNDFDPVNHPRSVRLCSHRRLPNGTQPYAPCESCAAHGQCCTIGGRLFYEEDNIGGLPSNLNPKLETSAIPTHLYLTKHFPYSRDPQTGYFRRPASMFEATANPTDRSLDNSWIGNLGGSDVDNANIGLKFQEPYACLPTIDDRPGGEHERDALCMGLFASELEYYTRLRVKVK